MRGILRNILLIRNMTKIETEARENKRGLWQDKNHVAPWTWRDIKKQKRALEKSTPF